MRKRLIFAVVAFCIAGFASAQSSLQDVVKYSQTGLYSTARNMAMGGAMGAVGADFSSTQINPAGLGLYRSSQLLGTGMMGVTGNKADYIGTNTKDSKFGISLPNLGLVINTINIKRGKEVEKGLAGYSFAFGYSRINDFNRNITVDGNNNKSNYLNSLAEYANQYTNWQDVLSNGSIDPAYPEELAWVANGIRLDSAQGRFFSNFDNMPVHQHFRIQQSGRQTDWNLSAAVNISHRIYLGIGIGLPAVRYTNSLIVSETAYDTVSQTQRSYETTSDYTTQGSGYNVKIGAVVRASDWLRLGLAYHSPTKYSLTDNFSYSYTAHGFKQGIFVYSDGEQLKSGPFDYKYTITTPQRMVASAAFIYKKVGMLSVDYERIFYTQAHTAEIDLDTAIKTNFRNTSNIRIGAEYIYKDLRFRAGFAFVGNPYANFITSQVKETNLNVRTYSVGIGYQSEDLWYVDAAFYINHYSDYYTPYTLHETGKTYYSALNKVTTGQLMLTVGTKF